MTTPPTPREPLDLEVIRSDAACVVETHDGYVTPESAQYALAVCAAIPALLARIRELEAERPDWSDEQIEALQKELGRSYLAEYGSREDPVSKRAKRDIFRSALRAAGIVPNVARWRDMETAPNGKVVLVIDENEDIRLAAAHGTANVWLTERVECDLFYPIGWQPLPADSPFDPPLPAPPTTEAT
jgi:hypothetical protein